MAIISYTTGENYKTGHVICLILFSGFRNPKDSIRRNTSKLTDIRNWYSSAKYVRLRVLFSVENSIMRIEWCNGAVY